MLDLFECDKCDKLYAVITNPDGNLLLRQLYQIQLHVYMSTTGAMQGKGLEKFMEDAKVGDLFNIKISEEYSWMIIVRLH